MAVANSETGKFVSKPEKVLQVGTERTCPKWLFATLDGHCECAKVTVSVMNSGRQILSWLMLLGIVLLFFFPVSFGSYQSTHGPTSTVNSAASNPVVTVVVVTVALAFALVVANRDRSFTREPVEVLRHSVVVRELLCTLRC